ncbi:Phage protein [Listeria floridensis FSL S10-1187]|uniref:Phage protein n=2 Tax=Listeria floridensis TaxID=1494962 RepID=A0ABP3ATC1_9LIST|nr:Phage protein [Listeria floridensis FSL S10-1187]
MLFFESLIEEYKKLNTQQSKQTIQQIEAIKPKVFEVLVKYADKDENIPRSKNRSINRELEAMLPDFHKEVSDAIEQVINETTSWTTDKVIEFFAVTFGVSLIATSTKEALNKEVINNVYKYRWPNGTNLTDIQYWHARDILDSIRQAVNTKSKAGLSEALKEVEKVLKANRWKTENIVKSDGVNAYRESIIENAKKK